MGIAPEYTRFLEALSHTEDLTEARQRCQQFLQMTAPQVPARAPRSPEELFLALLSGQNIPSAEQLFEDMTRKLYRSFLLVVLVPEPGQELPEALFRQGNRQPDSWAVRFEQKLVWVTASTHAPLRMEPFAEAAGKYALFGGASRPFSSVLQLPTAYAQGNVTVKTLQILGRTQSVACYDDFLMFRLLDGMRDDVDLTAFCLPEIQILQTYDSRHDAELCRTLLCYLEHAKNATHAAEVLHIHRNTVHYRINKCMELLPHLDFSNDYLTFLLMLSLYIAEYGWYRKTLDHARSLT